jgi:uncharacterized RDD family membrane protein YckC
MISTGFDLSGTGPSAWTDLPPDPLFKPDLYDGLLWRRAFGYLIDVLVLGVLGAAAWFALGLLVVLSFGLLLPLLIVALALLPLAYHTLFLAYRGQTPGMAALDVEVRSWNGRRPEPLQAFVQTAVFYLSVALTSWLILLVALFTNRNRTIHDYLAGTLAVRRSALFLLKS